MITPRPLQEYFRHVHEADGERRVLLRDLQAHPSDYLAHADGMVRALAAWALEYYNLGPCWVHAERDAQAGTRCLDTLYARLRALATAGDPA